MFGLCESVYTKSVRRPPSVYYSTVAIGRALSILSLYDLLANLIPGVAWAIVTILLFPVDWFAINSSNAPGTFVAAVIVFGFIGGHIAQWFGSSLDYKLQERNHDGNDLFTRTMSAIADEQDETPIGNVTRVEEEFWGHAQKQFGLPDDFPKSSKLLLLVLSYLETRPATRASRFQAIHTFHRSMWATSILATGMAIIAIIFAALGWTSTTWPALIVIVGGTTASIFVFNNRKRHFEKTFLRYVFLDFYQDQTNENPDQTT